MAEEYLSTDPNAGLQGQSEYLSTDPNAGLEKPEGETLGSVAKAAGQAALETGVGLVKGLIDPRNLQTMLAAPTDYGTFVKNAAGLALSDIAGIQRFTEPETPLKEKISTGLNLGLQAAGLIPGVRFPKLREIALGEKPPIQGLEPPPIQELTPQIPETPITDTVAQAEPDLTAVNRELAPITESPEAIAEPFPSISRSAEEQRRIELQQEVPKVREAISLDEIRLMRERTELEAQNDIARQATGGTHPAVDERLGQIDEELTTIANRELQTLGGGEISAIKEGEIPEGNIPEYPGDGEGRSPAETGGGGGIESSSEIQGRQEVVQPVPQPEQPVVSPTEEVGISRARTETELGEGSVEPGVGAELGSGFDYGRDYLNKGGDPRLPIRRAQATGLVGKNEVGIVHAELDRLRGERNTAAQALEADPTNPALQERFTQADDAQRAWRKELQPVLTKASDALREAYAQSVPDVDPSTYQGLADLFDENFKGERQITPEMRTVMARAAKGVRDVREIANNGIRNVEQKLTQQLRGRKVMTPEELDADLKSVLEKEFKDCIVAG